MATIGELRVSFDTAALQRMLDAAVKAMRTSGPPTTPASVTTVALAAAAASGSARKVTRRALLGLGMGQRE